MPRPTVIPGLALTASAALLLAAVSTVAGPASTAAAAEPPTGSTLVVPALGTATPGEALTGSATVTAPDDTVDTDPVATGVQGDPGTAPDPVAGQLVTLSVDHGFFTTGQEELPSVVGAPAGNLAGLGPTTSAVTDANGQVTFQIGIERDLGFDDDGLVSAVVTARAGSLVTQQSADWDATDPLNGQVQVALAPQARQVNPVAPAVSGDYTYYDVTTRDQFGNPVDAQPVDLGYSGMVDDFDYSDDFVVSDLTADGDLWVLSLVPGNIVVTGTWTAPSYLYADTAGTATTGTREVEGSATASFYDIVFGASTFAISSTAPDAVPVGSTATQTVTVLDQRGNPARGFQVEFFRFGPDDGGSEQRATRLTNARGQASYSFVGSNPGNAKITAVVSDGVDRRTLVSEVAFRIPVKVKLSGKDDGAADVLKIKSVKLAAGAKVKVFRLSHGKLKAVKAKGLKLDGSGKATVEVADGNGRRATKYVVEVQATATTFGVTSGTAKVR